VGDFAPDSYAAIADCDVPAVEANSCWVSPAWERSFRIRFTKGVYPIGYTP